MADVGSKLGVVLRYERGLAAQPLLEALLDTRGGDHPSDVRQAADGVLRAHAPWALDLAGSARTLVECAGDRRDVRLFCRWAFGGGQSLEQTARQEGLSSQRVGRLVHRAAGRVRDAAAAAAPWPWLVSTARRSLAAT